MDEQAKHDLLSYRTGAQNALEAVRFYAEVASAKTGESAMTADYIWGNCTLEQLEAHLDGASAYQLTASSADHKEGTEMLLNSKKDIEKLDKVELIAVEFSWECPHCAEENFNEETTDVVQCSRCGYLYGSQTYTHKLNDAEAVRAQQAERIEKQDALIQSIDALIQEEMGEWYSVEHGYVPVSMANLSHMRNAIAEFGGTE